MKKAFDRVGNLVHAKDAHKGINGYTCPCCREEVTKAEGVRQSAHFRHRGRQKREYCDLYVQGLGNFDSFNDYATKMRIPYITFEENEDDWDFYARFPKIRRGLTSMFEDFQLYFNVTCLEMGSQISAIKLRHDSDNNKMKISPRDSYHFDIDDKEAAKKLELHWPIKIIGFTRGIYIFRFIHGEFVRVEQESVTLSDVFYVVAKRTIIFPEKIMVQKLKSKNGWFAYRIQLPEVMDDRLIGSFYRETGYRLQNPFYYLDLLTPSTYGRKDYAYMIYSSMCSMAITFQTFRKNDFTVVHISPDMTSKQYEKCKEIVEISNLEQGFHTFYMKNHEGKMLNLYVDRKANQHRVIEYEAPFIINGENITVFKDKKMNIQGRLNIQGDYPLPLLKKEIDKFPYVLSRSVSDHNVSEGDKLYTPGVWSFEFIGNEMDEKLENNWSDLILAYLKIESTKTFIITNKKYQGLLNLVETIVDESQKKKLKFFLTMYRNRVPKEVKDLLDHI
ncbi:hypothetical protein [Bacillus mycoides]|uniref:hypothetical protein n=1 Tax=Bacillus mycoides TaxID=1405 RepID=UPI0009948D3D|nr:hypothetical protein [Bacillus mycoides]MED1630400.1 hypothetical protein [Bacillus mycoides]OOR59990.1 hypothetical protein BGP34_04060 [Bacillus mycoides]HDR7646295.1 hypothetical protein [Bacillus mycoides]